MNEEGALYALIDYAYALATKYGEGSATLACEMYEALAEVSGINVPSAMPAPTATKGTVAKAVNGTIMQNSEVTAGAVGRLVKLAGVDKLHFPVIPLPRDTTRRFGSTGGFEPCLSLFFFLRLSLSVSDYQCSPASEPCGTILPQKALLYLFFRSISYHILLCLDSLFIITSGTCIVNLFQLPFIVTIS